jgi:hypothetical protein
MASIARSAGATEAAFGLDAAMQMADQMPQPSDPRPPAEVHEGYLADAERNARGLRALYGHKKLKTTERDLIPFVYL